MHSSAVRCGSSAAPVATAEDADDGMNPTLYVPNPMAGWGVPSRRATVGQERSVCFCSGEGIVMHNLVEGLEGMDDDVERELINDRPADRRAAFRGNLGRRFVVAVVVTVLTKSRDAALSAMFIAT